MDLRVALLSFLQALPPRAQLLIAYSGGVDSQVLLHALKQLQTQVPDLSLRAVHLNHGLQAQATHWKNYAQQFCADLQISLQVADLTLNVRGSSIEAVARDARYAYFAQLLQPGEILCTAHHQDDQLETVLLQLLRGAGPKGLAAMANIQTFASGYHARPLLRVTRETILTYAQQQQLTWVHDESNENIKFDRNFLRLQLIPVLKQRWGAAAQTVSRAAEHCASAQALLEDYLHVELMQLFGHDPRTLSRSALARLPVEKQAYLLRTWLLDKKIPLPNTRRLAAIQQLLTARNDAQSTVIWQSYCARFYRDDLFIEHGDFFKPALPGAWSWDGKTILHLPQGQLSLSASPLGRISPRILAQPLTVCFRDHTHPSIKKISQATGIAPWQRWQLPLIYSHTELIAIADRWLNPDYLCQSGTPGLQLFYLE